MGKRDSKSQKRIFGIPFLVVEPDAVNQGVV